MNINKELNDLAQSFVRQPITESVLNSLKAAMEDILNKYIRAGEIDSYDPFGFLLCESCHSLRIETIDPHKRYFCETCKWELKPIVMR